MPDEVHVGQEGVEVVHNIQSNVAVGQEGVEVVHNIQSNVAVGQEGVEVAWEKHTGQESCNHTAPCDCEFAHYCDDGVTSANPISLRYGEKRLEVTDLSLNTPAGQLDFVRAYKQSQQDALQFMGLGWTHNHHITMTLPTGDPQTITLRMPGGGEATFTETGTGSDWYEADPGSTAFIVWDGQDYVLTATNKAIYTFNSQGRLTAHEWPNGETWSYSYDNGDLASVEDAYGRKLVFRYYTSGAHSGQLYRVGDHTFDDTDPQNPVGRYVEFAYVLNKVESGGQIVDGTDSLLASVTDLRGQVWTYDYYGQQQGEDDPEKLNLLTRRESPLVDTTGDGTADGTILQEELEYTLTGGEISGITQRRGMEGQTALIETEFAFQPGGLNITTETVAGKVTTHRFFNGVYGGAEDPAGNFGYQTKNQQYRPEQQKDANGNATELRWSSDGKLLEKVTDAQGQKTAFAYDADDRLQRSIDAEGRETLYVYEDENSPRQPSAVVVSQGENLAVNGDMELDSDWASVGTPTTNEQSSSQVDTGSYSRHVEGETGEGIESQTFDLDATRGYLATARVYRESGSDQVTMQLVDSQSQVLIDVDTSGDEEKWETLYLVYDPASSLSDVTLQFVVESGSAEFYVDSVVILDSTQILRWQEFAYDASGRVTSEKEVDPADPDDADGLRKTTRSYYSSGDGEGLLEQVTQTDIGGSDDVTTTYFYDSAGRVVQVNKSSNFGGCEVSRTVYDPAGNVVATICNYVNAGDPPETAAEAAALYDPAKPEENQVTTHEYDALGRRIATTANAGSDFALTTATVYDALDRVVRTIRNYTETNEDYALWVWDETDGRWEDETGTPISHGMDDTENLVSDTAYNERGMVRLNRDVLGNVTLFGYDDAGRLVKTVRNASVPEYDNSYGANGDPELSSYAAGEDADQDVITTQQYDPAGNLVKQVDPLGRATFTVFDALNRAVKAVRSAKEEATIDLPEGHPDYVAGNDPRSASYTPSEDPDRDLIERTEYDALGRVKRTRRLIDSRGGAETWEVTLFGYDELGRQVKVIRGASEPEYDITADPDLSEYEPSSDPDKDIVSETIYDEAGRVRYSKDVNGAESWIGYDGLDRQERSVSHYSEGDDSFLDWVWDENDERWEESGAAVDHGTQNDQNLIGQTVYDADGRVKYTRDGQGIVTLNSYDALGRRVAVVQNATNPTYDTANDPDLGEYPASGEPDEDVITRTVYDAEGRVLATVDRYGNQTRFEYDNLGRRVRTIRNYNNGVYHPDQPDMDLISETVYDRAGRVVSTIGPTGVETHYEYDQLGRRIKTIQNYVAGYYDPDYPDQDVISETTYDRAGQAVETVDARGTKTAFSYDNAGRRMAVTQAAESPLAATTYTCFDKAGRTLRMIQNWIEDEEQPAPDAQDANGDWLLTCDEHGPYDDRNLVTEYELDALGRVVKVVDPLGNETETTYYKDGQVESTTDPAGAVTQYRYDGLRRRVLVVQNHQDNGEDPADWVWDDETDERYEESDGTPIDNGAEHDQNVIVMTGYDLAGRRAARRDPNGSLTSYAYDGIGRRTELMMLPGHATLERVWETTYGDLPDHEGYRQTLRDPNGYDTQRNFDRLGRLVGVSYLGENPKLTPDVRFAYDEAGRRVLMSEADGAGTVRETHYAYDDLGRLAAVGFDEDGDGDVEQTVSYRYDAGGLRTRLTLPDGLEVRYEYDAQGRLVRLSDWDNQGTGFAYDLAGRLISAERSSGLRSRYVYDTAGRLTLLRHVRHDRVLGHFAYDLDSRGNRVEALEYVPHAGTGQTTIASGDKSVDYFAGSWTTEGDFEVSTDTDAALQVGFFGTRATLTVGRGSDHGIFDIYLNDVFWRSVDGYAASSGEQELVILLEDEGPHVLEVYNTAENNPSSSGYKLRFKQMATNRQYDLHTTQYAYDGLSRLIDADVYPGINLNAMADRAYDYAYDPVGNRTQKVVTLDGVQDSSLTYTYNALNQLTGDGSSTYEYDANGNLIKTNGQTTHTYDRANRLLSYGDSSYAYDGQGNRVSQTVDSVVTQYLLDVQPGLATVLAATTGEDITRYLHGPLGLQSQHQPDDSWAFPVVDGLGSVRGVVSEDLSHLESRQYTPYGEEYGTTGTEQTEFGFTGEPVDANGLVHLRARYYDPAIGRFFQTDPSQMEANLYQYGFSNPVKYVDPSGYSPLSHCFSIYNGLMAIGKLAEARGALGFCADRTLEAAASLFEHSVDPSDGPFGPLTLEDELYEPLKSELPVAAHFMYAFIGRADGSFKRFDLLGKPRYMNLLRFLREENIIGDIKANFANCVIEADPTRCGGAGIETSGSGLRNAGFGQIAYQNPLWRFRVGFSTPNIRFALGTFSIGAHTNFATVTRENGEIVYRAQIEAWDNYDWMNNDNPEAEGEHPFGIRASEMAAIYSTGFVKPYTVFGGLVLTVRAPDYGACSEAIPLQMYRASVSQIQPTGQTGSDWITMPLSQSGFVPFHNRSNTDNVFFYP